MNAALRSPLGKTTLDATVFTIGSSPDNQLVIDDMKVSAHHAEISQDGQSYSITDLGSTHGTYVNSQRLDWNTAYPLTPGSTITIGDTTFTYEEEHADSASPSSGIAETPAGESGAAEGADYTYPQTYSYAQTLPGSPAPGLAEPSTDYTPTPRRSGRRWLWITLVVLVILGLAGGGTAVYFFTRATPEKAIDAYCNALRGQDYNSAYDMLSTTLHNSSTERDFAAKEQAIGHTTICSHDNANITGNIATASLNLVAGGQSFAGIISLKSENGQWKISVPPSSPELTLTIFCNALRAGDTHTAYNEYSQGLKNANPEAQFMQTFSGVTCAFSSVAISGSSSTANIVFVNSSGPSNPYIILLIQDPANYSDWRIDGIQPA